MSEYRNHGGQGIARSRSRPGRRMLVAALVAILALGLGTAFAFTQDESGQILPGVRTADGLELGGLTRDKAMAKMNDRYAADLQRQVILRYDNRSWVVSAPEMGAHIALDAVADAAYAVGRRGSVLDMLGDQLASRWSGVIVNEPALTIDEGSLAQRVASLALDINAPATDAKLSFSGDGRVTLVHGQTASQLDQGNSSAALRAAFTGKGSAEQIDLPVKETPPAVTDADLEPARAKLSQILAGPLTLRFADRSWTIAQQDLAKLLGSDEWSTRSPDTIVQWNEGALSDYTSRLAKEINQDSAKPRLRFVDGKVSTLKEGQPGYKLDTMATVQAIQSGASSDDRTVALPVQVTTPPGLGDGVAAIKERISSATTIYGGGIANRRHNVELAASKLNGTVVGPGETFSFNKEFGPMTLDAGFRWGYGISREGGELTTVPSVAGGICQVATTLFQSVFWGGYQIEERHGHSYWIERYGQPPSGMKGLDATVDQIYDKNGNLKVVVDFRFTNTTQYSILVEAITDGANITFNLYSTKTGWTVQVAQPQIDNVVRADPELVTKEDPKIPAGQQIYLEAAQDGFRATIVRTVTEPGKAPRVLKLVKEYEPARNMVAVGTGR